MASFGLQIVVGAHVYFADLCLYKHVVHQSVSVLQFSLFLHLLSLQYQENMTTYFRTASGLSIEQRLSTNVTLLNLM